MKLNSLKGATPIDADQLKGLIPDLSTQDELNEFEHRNIIAATTWTMGGQYNGSGDINISPNHDDNKFVIAHEFGHAVGDLGTSGVLVSGSCSHTDLECFHSTHHMASKEFASCGAQEGWAHFHAAATWNSSSQADCIFEYYKPHDGDNTPLVNCEAGQSTFPVRYMENECTATPHGGRATELDWLRTFWDMHAGNSSNASFNDMLDWASLSVSWSGNHSNTYFDMDAAANTKGGTVNSRWDQWKAYNGIDH